MTVKGVPDEFVFKTLAVSIERKKKQLEMVDAKIKGFERKYQISFERFEKNMDSSFKEHTDWFNWNLLIEKRKQLKEEIRSMEKEITKVK